MSALWFASKALRSCAFSMSLMCFVLQIGGGRTASVTGGAYRPLLFSVQLVDVVFHPAAACVARFVLFELHESVRPVVVVLADTHPVVLCSESTLGLKDNVMDTGHLLCAALAVFSVDTLVSVPLSDPFADRWREVCRDGLFRLVVYQLQRILLPLLRPFLFRFGLLPVGAPLHWLLGAEGSVAAHSGALLSLSRRRLR